MSFVPTRIIQVPTEGKSPVCYLLYINVRRYLGRAQLTSNVNENSHCFRQVIINYYYHRTQPCIFVKDRRPIASDEWWFEFHFEKNPANNSIIFSRRFVLPICGRFSGIKRQGLVNQYSNMITICMHLNALIQTHWLVWAKLLTRCYIFYWF